MIAKSNVEFGRAGLPNIIFVIGSLAGGGAERVITDMANYWNSKGWGTSLATWEGPDISDFYELNSGVERIWLDVYPHKKSVIDKLRANILRVSKLRRLLLDKKPDVVLSFIDTSNVLTIIASLGLNTNVVVSERINAAHYFGIAWQWKILRKFLYRRANTVVVQTHDVARWIGSKCKVKAVVIPNSLRPLPNTGNQREQLIIAVGRLSKQKGFDLLLRAFRKISNDFENWRVVIIGQGSEHDNLLQLRSDLMLDERVEFAGQVQDVVTWMARAGLVVQPSRFEGFPNVILEAMGMGAAVISANCPSGPSELINDGINGLLVKTDDVSDLARAMKCLMSQPDVRNQIGKEAVKVREIYRQEKIMMQWEKILLCQD